MGLTTQKENNALFLTIVGGDLVQKVAEGTQGAVKRVYETPDGGKGEKWEIHHRDLTGYISGIDFRDTDFGEQCNIKITDGVETAVLSIPTESRYFMDFGQKLSNIDFNEQIVLNPYDFTGNNGKQIRGISIQQNGQKVENYFWDKENKKLINGIVSPENNGKDFDKDDWKMYFIRLKKFLKKHIESQIGGIGNFKVQQNTQKTANEVFHETNYEQDKKSAYPEYKKGDIPPEPEEDLGLPF